MFHRLRIFSFFAVSIVTASAQLSERSESVLGKLEAFKIETRAKAEALIQEKTLATIKFLERELVDITKTGDLEAANLLNKKIKVLKAEIPDDIEKSVSHTTLITAQDAFKDLKKRLRISSRCDHSNSFFKVGFDDKPIFETKAHAFFVLTLNKAGELESERSFPLEKSPELRPKLVEYVESLPKNSLVVLGVSGTTRNGRYADVTEMVGGKVDFIPYVKPYYLFGVKGMRRGAMESVGTEKEISTKKQ